VPVSGLGGPPVVAMFQARARGAFWVEGLNV